jgi:hypothetical protein
MEGFVGKQIQKLYFNYTSSMFNYESKIYRSYEIFILEIFNCIDSNFFCNTERLIKDAKLNQVGTGTVKDLDSNGDEFCED